MRTAFASVRIHRTNRIGFPAPFAALVVSLALVCGEATGATFVAARHIAVGKPPSAIVLSPDGQTLFVGLDQRLGFDGGIAAFSRTGDSFTLVHESAVPQGVSGLALSPDRRTLVATTPAGLLAIDAVGLLGASDAPMTALLDGDAPGSDQVVFARDGRFVFFTNMRAANLGVARIEPAHGVGRPPRLTLVGHVPLDRLPGGLAISADGRELFVTSEIDNVDSQSVPGGGDERLGRTRCTINLGPNGVLTIVSVEAALHTPLHAVVARTAAGCAPVRVTLADGGKTAWISDRGERRLLAFDVSSLRAGAGSLLASVELVSDPVGMAVSNDGRSIMVASHQSRDERSDEAGTLSQVDIASALAGRAGAVTPFSAGALPREVVAAPDGSYIVTNYEGRSIDIVTPQNAKAGGVAPAG